MHMYRYSQIQIYTCDFITHPLYDDACRLYRNLSISILCSITTFVMSPCSYMPVRCNIKMTNGKC